MTQMMHILPHKGALLGAGDRFRDPLGEGETPIIDEHNLKIGIKITFKEKGKEIITPEVIKITTQGVFKETITQEGTLETKGEM